MDNNPEHRVSELTEEQDMSRKPGKADPFSRHMRPTPPPPTLPTDRKCVRCGSTDQVARYGLWVCREVNTRTRTVPNYPQWPLFGPKTTASISIHGVGVVNLSAWVCRQCVKARRAQILPVAATCLCIVLALAPFTFICFGNLGWLLAVPIWLILLAVGGWASFRLHEGLFKVGENLAVARFREELRAQGYPVCEPGHVHRQRLAGFRCEPPACDGPVIDGTLG